MNNYQKKFFKKLKISGILLIVLYIICIFLPRNKVITTNPLISDQPIVFANGGASDEFPANSMAAFERAYQLGASFMTRICRTKDNIIVLSAYDKLDYQSDHQGYIHDYTYAQLQAFDFGYLNDVDELGNLVNLKRFNPTLLDKYSIVTLDELVNTFPSVKILIENYGDNQSIFQASRDVGGFNRMRIFGLDLFYNGEASVFITNNVRLVKAAHKHQIAVFYEGDQFVLGFDGIITSKPSIVLK